MKQGANATDIAWIRKMAEGVPETDDKPAVPPKTSVQISRLLQIDEKVVKSFMPKKPTRAKKPPAEE